MYVTAIAVIAGFAAAAIVVTVQQDAGSAGLLKPEDRRLLALGQTLYGENCASCHGVKLEGQVKDWQSPGADGLMPAPPHDETGHTWHHPDEILFEITKYGIVAAANLTNYTSAMPVYEDVLTDAEIIAVLSYIKSTWPDEIRDRHDEMNARYALEPK
ncbi:cytochrome c [Hoeflea sp. YIM 152468]|uniref:c-type cytochrome n=1 Tax=Hoeflea sp. YIM 152468 TaxID=3031759 RepID=UPI0023DA1260|nr:cytochrome c [Hoeflea sp. YIM 152468]MDF1608618.1 cytochrome c [Hoeflea sp. YIM 152468]